MQVCHLIELYILSRTSHIVVTLPRFNNNKKRWIGHILILMQNNERRGQRCMHAGELYIIGGKNDTESPQIVD